MSDTTKQMPVVTLLNMAILPGMMIHFDVSRKRSQKAVERGMSTGEAIFLVAQRDENIEDPELSQLYEYGTIATVKQLIKMPHNQIRVLVSATQAGELLNIEYSESILMGDVLPSPNDEIVYPKEEEAILRSLKDIVEIYQRENTKVGQELKNHLSQVTNLNKYVELVGIYTPLNLEQKQMLLSAGSITEKSEIILALLINEIEIARIRKELQVKLKDKIDKNQKDYILREQLKVIKEELGEGNQETEYIGYMDKLSMLQADSVIKERICKEVNRYKSLAGTSFESAVARTYIETLLSLPWDAMSKDHFQLKEAARVLDREHYGLTKVKERILEFLAVRQVAQEIDSPILCLVGPPGTGKTSIAKSIAQALKKEYVRVCLGGVKDESEIRGHRRTYVGALPGRIVNGFIQAKVKNPLMLFDEIDKVGNDFKGDTSSALLEVLDSEQNAHFVDHYIELPIDLSKVLFIATANSTQSIPKPLLDRMEIIEVNSYTSNEKFHIAKHHLLKKQLKKHGLTKEKVRITDSALNRIIDRYTNEAGVRELERKIAEVLRKVVKASIEEKKDEKQIVSRKNLLDYLGREKYLQETIDYKDEIGIVRGLAWTSAGGDTLVIEVNTMNGKGEIILTGQLGDVMKESARIGVSYLRSVSHDYAIPADYFRKHDIHIHIPEGAVPKDGPSAGITMATAILSAITERPVRHDLAMTGEVTLRGRVLPIGGLKEKLLAAKKAKVRTVLIPLQNQKDLEELETEITEGINICMVSSMEEVIKQAMLINRREMQ